MFVDSPSRVLPRLRERLRDLVQRGLRTMTASMVTTLMVGIVASSVPGIADAAAKKHAAAAAPRKQVASTQPKRDRYAAIVIDAATGEVLHAENSNNQNYPASMTKMMTLYMVFEALQSGALTLDTRIPVSAHAASMQPSKLGLQPGDTIRVEDAIKSVVTKSANDMAVALGEAIGGGSEANAAALMTRKAHALGMTRSNFANVSGLPNLAQKSTARDMAMLAQALVYRFPQYYPYFNTRSFTYEGHTMRNHNGLLGKVDGMDGLKTGFINASGFNMTVSVKRDGTRLIAVVFGGDTVAWRNERTTWLVEEGFKPGHGQLALRAGELRAPVRYRGFTGAPAPVKPGTAPAIVEDVPVASVVSPLGSALPAAKPDAPALAAMVARASDGEGEGDIDDDAAEGTLAALDTRQRTTVAALAAAPAVVARPAQLGRTVISTAAVSATPSLAAPRSAEAAPVVAGWGVQIGAYRDEPSGNAAVKDISSKMPGVLAAAQPSVIAVSTPRGTLYRARLLGLSEQNARAVCENLTKEGRGCLTVPPPALGR